MVFFFQNCSDLLWEKNCSGDWEELLKFEAEGWEFAKFLRPLYRTIYSNSEKSVQFLKTECFLKSFLEVRTIRIQIGKNNWDDETCRES